MVQTNMNPLQTPVTEANTQFVSVAQDYPQNQQKSLNTWKIAGCVLGVVAFICVASLLTVIGFGVYGIQMFKEALDKELDKKVCLSDDASIRRVYKENTTSRLKRDFSEDEFVRNVKEFSADCKTVRNTPAIGTLVKSWIILENQEGNNSVILFEGKVDNYYVSIEFVSENGGDYMVNRFDVK